MARRFGKVANKEEVEEEVEEMVEEEEEEEEEDVEDYKGYSSSNTPLDPSLPLWDLLLTS
ncbi:hypothetical protein E2C01_086140 [Portunus trituberculatus]|uniref:Uncharacterized protein n=1 Tax=Portunus trituberculatus TaxID=210409 RepID=A0A5B7J9G7_PORTR|nr:hypothetical protein [Portunus trituberculatus]